MGISTDLVDSVSKPEFDDPVDCGPSRRMTGSVFGTGTWSGPWNLESTISCSLLRVRMFIIASLHVLPTFESHPRQNDNHLYYQHDLSTRWFEEPRFDEWQNEWSYRDSQRVERAWVGCL